MACKDTNWHDVYLTYFGHCVGTCNYCGYKLDQVGHITQDTICPKCGGKRNEPDKNNS